MKSTIIDSFLEVVAKFPEKEALIYKADHHFASLSYEQIYLYAQKLAVFLQTDLKLTENQNVMIVSENRPEWVISDIASLILGAVFVPVHQVLSAVQIKTIFDQVKPKVIFVSGKENLNKVLEISTKTPIIYFDTNLNLSDPENKERQIFSFKEKVFETEYQKQIDPVKHKEDRVVTIIFTSGTTGNFKGAMLTNKNIISNLSGVLMGVPVTDKDKFLSILPLSHVFERTVGYYLPLLLGATISYVEDPNKLGEIAEVERPTIIIAVPRLYEKVYDKVKEKAEQNLFTKKLFIWAFRVGKEKNKTSWQYKVANLLLFNKIRQAFGGQIRFFVSGAATLPRAIGEFFDTLSIPVLEGYGLTETSPIVSNNTLKERKYGTVGKPLKNLTVKVVKGELWIKGPSVMAGYYQNEAATNEAITKDGWFKTGDLAEIDKDGYITILAREKEIIALTTGKKVSPAFVEEKLEMCPCVSQAFVFGDNRKHVGALIVPNKEKLNGVAKEAQVEKIKEEINLLVNPKVASYEQIRKFALLSDPFSVDNGMLTPTLKLRRAEIEKNYLEEIEKIYQ